MSFGWPLEVAWKNLEKGLMKPVVVWLSLRCRLDGGKRTFRSSAKSQTDYLSLKGMILLQSFSHPPTLNGQVLTPQILPCAYLHFSHNFGQVF
jgi:hypothetical protein